MYSFEKLRDLSVRQRILQKNIVSDRCVFLHEKLQSSEDVFKDKFDIAEASIVIVICFHRKIFEFFRI